MVVAQPTPVKRAENIHCRVIFYDLKNKYNHCRARRCSSCKHNTIKNYYEWMDQKKWRFELEQIGVHRWEPFPSPFRWVQHDLNWVVGTTTTTSHMPNTPTPFTPIIPAWDSLHHSVKRANGRCSNSEVYRLSPFWAWVASGAGLMRKQCHDKVPYSGDFLFDFFVPWSWIRRKCLFRMLSRYFNQWWQYNFDPNPVVNFVRTD